MKGHLCTGKGPQNCSFEQLDTTRLLESQTLQNETLDPAQGSNRIQVGHVEILAGAVP